MLHEFLEARNMALKSGMDSGLNASYALVDTVLATLGKGRRILQSAGAIVGGFAVVFALNVVTDVILESTGFFPPQNRPQAYTWGLLLLALIY